MAENRMIVSDLGLFNVNRKIINSRKFNKENISPHGEIGIIDGIAGNFSSENYLTHSISFSGSKVIITISGTFVPDNREQVAWFLLSSEPTLESIALQFNNNHILLVADSISNSSNARTLINLKYLNFEQETKFKIIVELSPRKCKLIAKINNTIYEKSTELNIPLNLVSLNKLYLGNDPTGLERFYWGGSLNVANFQITENNKVLYTPSSSYSLTFTRILMSDGTVPLTDSTIPVLNHVLAFDLEEITRSGNVILLTTQVDKDSKLLIKEIGLYANVDGEEFLFSHIKGLNVNKRADVPYDLMFTVNLQLSFVNAVGFPDVNSFLLEPSTPALYKNFKTVQEVVAYVICSLERIVYMNAEKIGYNKSQIFYRLQQEIEQEEDCYSNIQSYAKLLNKFKLIQEVIFNSESINYYNNLIISSLGEAFGFSIEDYATASVAINSEENWNFQYSFELTSNSTDDQVIAMLEGYEVLNSIYEEDINNIKSLVTGIRYSEEDDKYYLYLKIQNRYYDTYIIDENLTPIYLNQKYYVRINCESYHNLYSYKVLLSIDGENYNVIYSTVSENRMSNINYMYIGVESTYNSELEENEISNPLSSGIVYLMNWETNSDENWNTLDTITYQNKNLLQYYRIPDLYEESYRTRDINNPDCFIDILEDTETGNKDLIDFSHEEGFSLCMKINLKNSSDPKVILAKTDLINNPYFTLTYFNKNLAFSLYMEELMFTVQKTIPDEELSEYQADSVLITIVLDKNKNLKLYKNNELIDSFSGIFGTFKEASSYFLTNHLQDDVLTSICENIYVPDTTTEEYVELIQSNIGKYTENIIAIQGVLNEDDLYYINNLMDTNY